ncbi:MAG: hypothetical protein Q8P02_02520, partial [Candidatus Micrarchaeota archaeon]|nr:hypothetical protein [Candidatus Micrarchaeota archaeon]
MQTLRLTVGLSGAPARVIQNAVERGFSGSKTDVIRSALIAYGERYGLLDSDGTLKSDVVRSLKKAAIEEGLS